MFLGGEYAFAVRRYDKIIEVIVLFIQVHEFAFMLTYFLYTQIVASLVYDLILFHATQFAERRF